MNSPQQIRSHIQEKRSSLSAAMVALASSSINHYIKTQTWFQECQHIAFYKGICGEIDPFPLIASASHEGKICYLPTCSPPNKPHQLLFFPYTPGDDLVPNRYGILEPHLNLQISHQPSELDLVFVPLLAFDHQRNRLGWGKGYYDRTFSFLNQTAKRDKPQLIGLAYAFQEFSQLKADPWDVPLDRVIVFDTETTKIHTL